MCLVNLFYLDGLVQNVRLLERRELWRRRRGRRMLLLFMLSQLFVDVGDGEVFGHVLLLNYGVALKTVIQSNV